MANRQIKTWGSRYSADWYNCALMNYGRMADRPGFGAPECLIGLKLFSTVADGAKCLAIDQRGPGLVRVAVRLPFSSRAERRAAFAAAKAIYATLLPPG